MKHVIPFNFFQILHHYYAKTFKDFVNNVVDTEEDDERFTRAIREYLLRVTLAVLTYQFSETEFQIGLKFGYVC